MIRNKNIAPDAAIDISKIVGFGCGEVFYVAQGNGNAYNWLVRRVPADHLFTTIQGALDATVTERNDYVLVYPDLDDFDLSAPLTMTKKSVHLICPAGLGLSQGAKNACRVHQHSGATSAIITLSGQACEIAGFWFKPYSAMAAIEILGTGESSATQGGFAAHIHHNTIGLYTTGATNAAAIGAKTAGNDAGAYSLIENNRIMSIAGNATTMEAVISFGSPATSVRIIGNSIVIGDGNTVTAGISNASYKGETNYNEVSGMGASGGSGAATITTALVISAGGVAIGNRLGVASGADVSGGGANLAYVDNRNATNGGDVAI